MAGVLRSVLVAFAALLVDPRRDKEGGQATAVVSFAEPFISDAANSAAAATSSATSSGGMNEALRVLHVLGALLDTRLGLRTEHPWLANWVHKVLAI